MALLTPIDISLEVDLNVVNNTLESVHCNQYENGVRNITISLKKNGVDWNPTGYNIEIDVLKPSGTVIKSPLIETFEEGKSNGGYDKNAKIEGNVITLPINNKITVSAGRSDVSFRFYKEENDEVVEQLYTNVFYMNVHKTSVTDESIKDTTEFLQLTKYVDAAEKSATEAKESEDEAKATLEQMQNDDYVKQAKSWAIGDDIREGSDTDNSKYYSKMAESYTLGTAEMRPEEETDNAKYYYDKIQATESKLINEFGYVKECTFADLPKLGQMPGNVYKVSNAFISDIRFIDGEGLPYPSGTCVVWLEVGKWASLGGSATTFKFVGKNETNPQNLNSGDILFKEY